MDLVARVRAFSVVAVAAALPLACGGTPTSPPPAGSPEIACPVNISISGVIGSTQAVAFPSPTEVGGTPPVTVSCSMTSGASFQLGTTTVSCNAKDAAGRIAACTFTVTLSSARLSAMTFVAFGDSITAGQDGDNIGTSDTVPTTQACLAQNMTRFGAQSAARPFVVHLATAYPMDLQKLLTADFPGESIAVINEGSPGEYAATADAGVASGQQRLPCVLQADQPQALLLLEGINDLNDPPAETTPDMAASNVVAALAADIETARGAGVKFIFVSTLLPEVQPPGDCSSTDPDDYPCRDVLENTFIASVNSQIAAMVKSEGAVLVDGYSAFLAQDSTLATLIGPDGLHPTVTGYQVLAQTFASGILAQVPITSALRHK